MKLPINPLLYLVSLASLGGIGHAVYRYSDKTDDYDAKARARIKSENQALKQKGIAKNMNTERWDYRATWFWKQLADVNLTGKIEKKEEKEKEDKEDVTEAKPEIVQLDGIIEVICIARAGDETGVVVKYNTDVEVPEGQIVTPSAPSMKDTIPKGRQRRRSNIPKPAPTQNFGQAPPHHVKVGGSLWPKYDYVFLKSVAPDASFATFELRIEDKKDPEKGYPTQDVVKGNLDLPPDVLAKMGKVGAGGTATTPNKDGSTTPRAPASAWVDTPETTISRDGRVNVAKKDQDFLEKNGRDVWTDDVHMRDYSGGSGKHKIRGVQIRKLSGRVQKFGVNEGDVLISINGQPVTGMANAKKVGRRLYNKGVRNFKAEILRQGRIITRTYAFKK